MMATKFDSARDEALYAMTLDGTCETTGTVDGFGIWAAKIDVDKDFIWVHDGLTAPVPAGFYLVTEDALGFVRVREWPREVRDAEFEHLEQQYGEWLGDDED